jgi:tetratricopeptide (TPR) repeat protein
MSARHVLIAMIVMCVAAGATLAADDDRAAREQVGKPVQQAQLLLRQKKVDEALVRLRTADAVPNKSPYETYIIEETRAVALIDSGDYAGAVKALDGVLGTRVLPPAEAAKRLMSITQLEYRLKDYPKTIDGAQRYYKEGGGDPEPRRLMAQAYYLENDFADAARTIRQALADAGAPPDEALLLSLASSEFKLKNQDGYVDALEQLVASHPKHEYWVDLCRAVQQKPGFAPRLRLDLDRLEIAAGAIDTPEQYIEAAERALERGFPGDAKAFLDKGYAVGMLGKGSAVERQKRLVDTAKHLSDADQRVLPAEAKEADALANGIALEKLGEAYASYGRYDDAVIALVGALKKGGLPNPEDARLHLGVGQLAAGRLSDAKATFAKMSGTDGTTDLAQMWSILGAPR